MLKKTSMMLVMLGMAVGCSSGSTHPLEDLPPPYWQEMYAHHDKAGAECVEGEDCEVVHNEASGEEGHDQNKKATLILEYAPFFP
jgi:hypothetical protein